MAIVTLAPALGCGAPGGPAPLRVFAASSLCESFREIEQQFEAAHPLVDVQLHCAGSQALRLQIEQGAPVDVFASANRGQVQRLQHAGLAANPRVFALNELALITPSANPGHIMQLADLAAGAGSPSADATLLVAAKEVPAGAYTRDYLRAADKEFGPDFSMKVLARVVSNERNVRTVRAKVILGEVDAGFVYRSDLVGAPGLRRVDLPAEYQPIIEYLSAETPNTSTRGDERVEDDDRIQAIARIDRIGRIAKWHAFLASKAGRSTLQAHGFEVPA